MSEKSVVVQNLTQFRDNIKSNSGKDDVFDAEDLAWIQEELDRVRDFDSELEVLDYVLKRREAVLNELSERYRLTDNHPELMHQFAQKQSAYYVVRDNLLRAREMAQQ
jgi:hypothetical protein